LEESLNANHPLLERVRFLSISAANLDEFFMVRVAGLAGQVREGIKLKSPDGRTPEQQLEQLLREVERLQEDQQKSLSALMLLLDKEGIESISRDGLTKDEKTWLEDHFQEQVFPVLTPLSIDPAHPFPFIPNLGFSMALQLRHRRNGEEMSALLRLPVALKRFIRLPDRKHHVRFITLEEAVGLYIGKLFPGYEVKGSGTFRIIRDSDIEVEEESEDLVRLFET
ncbi:MAG: RNA degradosome polyphosphate kinase, partial [Mesorhizobium sp.]